MFFSIVSTWYLLFVYNLASSLPIYSKLCVCVVSDSQVACLLRYLDNTRTQHTHTFAQHTHTPKHNTHTPCLAVALSRRIKFFEVNTLEKRMLASGVCVWERESVCESMCALCVCFYVNFQLLPLGLQRATCQKATQPQKQLKTQSKFANVAPKTQKKIYKKIN